ncbi:D-glycero-alpha-D-manno-heptose-1,7-bisphosphate 7-phosphatase [Candidatus Leptofilum sp.]|uniref:D-glycero-alpha-D-manno-heptose-1,7-bisphosphate 7-phosphatase n=1 Tax=Candidatus Leptofilum sp. TaxID=3241576 RepID=UPI003B59EEF0
MPTKQPALFLDRDGVFIENRANYVRSWEDVEFFPQALEALARINEIPYKIIVVTNQSAVGRGIISLETAVTLNERILEVVRESNGRIDGSYLCPAKPGLNDPCRKPQPGMLLQAAEEHNLDLSQSIMIGDALTDIQAGQAAGVKQAILLLTGRGTAQAQLPLTQELPPFATFTDLNTALSHLFPHLP